jgi:hypothetical protein
MLAVKLGSDQTACTSRSQRPSRCSKQTHSSAARRYNVAPAQSSPKNRERRFLHITFEASSCVATLAAIFRGSLKWSSLFLSHSQYEYDCEENYDDAYDGKQPTVLGVAPLKALLAPTLPRMSWAGRSARVGNVRNDDSSVIELVAAA